MHVKLVMTQLIDLLLISGLHTAIAFELVYQYVFYNGVVSCLHIVRLLSKNSRV